MHPGLSHAICAGAGLALGLASAFVTTTSAGTGEAGASIAREAGWLRPDDAGQLERHLRGLDVAMIEVGYRFTELHFAGLDGNWPYAKYQAEKIRLALELALERRPKRTGSAAPFLSEDLPVVLRAIETQDGDDFAAAMERLRAACMRCHVLESVPHFTVQLPEQRISTIRTVQ